MSKKTSTTAQITAQRVDIEHLANHIRRNDEDLCDRLNAYGARQRAGDDATLAYLLTTDVGNPADQELFNFAATSMIDEVAALAYELPEYTPENQAKFDYYSTMALGLATNRYDVSEPGSAFPVRAGGHFGLRLRKSKSAHQVELSIDKSIAEETASFLAPTMQRYGVTAPECLRAAMIGG